MKITKIIIFIFLFSVSLLKAQDLRNVATINVDDLEDKEIEKLTVSLKKKGYTIYDAEKLLKSKGMPQVQIDKLKYRVEQLKETSTSNKGTDESSNLENSKEEVDTFGLLYDNNKKQPILNKGRDSLFGYDFFNNPKITFTPNITGIIPEKYQLGRGDVLQIDVWGASEATYKRKIDRQGNINIKGVGVLKLLGLDFSQAKSKISSFLSRVYSGINAPNSSYNKVYVGVTLAEVKMVQVNLVGEVKTPGTYSLTSLSTVLNALYASGGPTKNGDFRNISLIRGGVKLGSFDFYKYITTGSDKSNFQLKDQDVIIVGSYQRMVTVTGQVKRPGYYQMKNEETVADLFSFCGGLKPMAYKKSITIERISGVGKEMVEFEFNKSSTNKLLNGDVVFVKETSKEYTNKVSIKGAIKVSGEYQFVSGMTVSALIEKAAGLTKEAFLNRGLITRYNNAFDRKAVSISLIKGGLDVVLKPNDEVYIYNVDELRGKQTLKIIGAVNNADTYDYVEGMQIEDIIAMAGGLSVGADAKNIEVSRRNKNGGFENLGKVFKLFVNNDLGVEKKEQFYLKPFDVVSVRYVSGYSEQKTITVSGEVGNPGEYSITSKNERISDFLRRAGGLSPFAFIEGATLIRKKQGRIEQKQIDFLKELQKKDSVMSSTETSKNEFRIGINLKNIIENEKGLEDLVLEDGDELIIPVLKQTVEVRGEIYSPSLVQYVPGKSLRYYIDRAGGFSNQAKKNRSYVVYSNGSSDATSNFLIFKKYPKVKPGAIILVPRKDQTRRLSPQEVVSLTTGVSTLVILIDRFMSRNSK